MRKLAMAVLAACALSGCGSGDDEGARRQAPLSKAEYERQFKRVVARQESRPRLDTPPGAPLREQGEMMDKGLDRMRELAADLEKLPPPREVAGAHRDLVSAMRGIADDAEKVVAAMKTGDEQRAEALLGDPRTGKTFADRENITKAAAARSAFKSEGYDLGDVSAVP